MLRRWTAEHPGERVLLWLSGKDSAACLVLACDAGLAERIVPVHRYVVMGLECIESPLRAMLRQCGVTRPLVNVAAPHALNMLVNRHRMGPGRELAARHVQLRDVIALAKQRTGCAWQMSGEKMIDSLGRRGMFRQLEKAGTPGQDVERCKLFPVWNWTHRQVAALVRSRGLPLPAKLGGSERSSDFGLGKVALAHLRAEYPRDYARVMAEWPLADVAIERERLCQD